MIQETNLLSPTQSLLDSDTFGTDSSLILKRKVSFSDSDRDIDYNTKRKKKKVSWIDEVDETDFSHDAIGSSSLHDSDISEAFVSSSENDHVFDWIGTILNDGTGEASIDSTTPSTTTKHSERNVLEESTTDMEPLHTTDESDPVCDEMIALLAQDDADASSDNIFKLIRESFIDDRLLQHLPISTSHDFTSTVNDTEKSITLWTSNSQRIRFSRIEVREGLEQLVSANRQSAKTRKMLLNCIPKFSKSQSQQ